MDTPKATYKKTNPKLLENTSNYRKTKKGILTNSYNKQKERSKKNGLPCPSYSLIELHDRYLNDEKFNRLYLEWIKHGCNKQFKPSIDRINCKKAYTLDNIHVMTWAENRYKQTMGRRSRMGAVAQLMGNKIIMTYSSQRMAVNKTGLSQSNLSAALNGRRNYCGGYKWKYIYENPELL